jgi:hypothetical protein
VSSVSTAIVVCLFVCLIDKIIQNRIIKIKLLNESIDNYILSLEERVKNIIGDDANIVFMRSISIKNINSEGELNVRKRYVQRYLTSEKFDAVESLFDIPNFKIFDKERKITDDELYEYDNYNSIIDIIENYF